MYDPTVLIIMAMLSVGGAAKDFLFQTIPQDVPGFNELPTRYIRSVHETNGQLVVTTGAGLGFSNDAGQTYSLRTMRHGLPSNNVRKLAITDDGTFYALTYGGSLALAISQDGGASFKDITASLPNPNFPLGTYTQSLISVGKRVIMLMSDLRLYYNTDSEGGPFVEIDLGKELGILPSDYTGALKVCATANGDLVVGINESVHNSQFLNFVRVHIDGLNHTLAKITPANAQTAEYLQRKQNTFTCFTRNGSDELALTRLDTELAFLALNGTQVTYTHSLQIPTNSNFGDQPIYPTIITRAGTLFIMGYPTLMRVLIDANGKDGGFLSKQPNATDPRSPENQILDIESASNGDWLVATEWGWLRCDNPLSSCAEVISKSHRYYDSGAMDQNSQGFLFPGALMMTSATNSNSTDVLFWASEDDQAWTLDHNFLNPVPFTYPHMDRFNQISNAKARGNRMAIMTTDRDLNGRVIYVENGVYSWVDLPAKSRSAYPMVSGMSDEGDRVWINIERGSYIADFGGNFTEFKAGDLPGVGSDYYANGQVMLVASGDSSHDLALSFDRGKTFTMIAPEKLGLPAGKEIGLGSYRGYPIAVVGNQIFQLSLAPSMGPAKLIFTDTTTEKLSLRGTNDAGIWLDAGSPWNSDSRPRVITPGGNCYLLNNANGLSNDDDSMAFIAGTANSTLYFVGMGGIVRLQNGFNKTADCGVANLP